MEHMLVASYLIDVLRRLPPPPRGVPALPDFGRLGDVSRDSSVVFLDPLIFPRDLHLRRRPPPETLLASRSPRAQRHVRRSRLFKGWKKEGVILGTKNKCPVF